MPDCLTCEWQEYDFREILVDSKVETFLIGDDSDDIMFSGERWRRERLYKKTGWRDDPVVKSMQ